jgi:hypothetical protein
MLPKISKLLLQASHSAPSNYSAIIKHLPLKTTELNNSPSCQNFAALFSKSLLLLMKPFHVQSQRTRRGKYQCLSQHSEEEHHLPKLVDARPEAWVCGRPLAETVGSNPAGGMEVCLL